MRIAGLSHEFPPLRSLDAYPSNLPSELTSFVGREDQLQQLLHDLERNDLVTLTGTGGVGKTRLAVQACAEALPHFADGAWFVDLAPVRDGDQVTPAIATVLKVKERPGEALALTLSDALRDRRAIVLLDNGEHVIDDVSDLLLELRRRPIAAKFLVTSREPLGIDGEQVRRVASLRAAEAAELFVQRGSSVRADVDWAEYDADVIAICDQLDGIRRITPPPDPYYALVWEARAAGRNEESIALAHTGAALAVDSDNPWMGLVIRMQGCSARCFVDVDAAIAEANELIEIADRLEVPVFRAAAEFALGQALALAGRRAECDTHLDRAAEMARGAVLHVQISVSMLRGMLDAEDRPEDAMASLREAIELGERHAVMPDILANAYEAVAAIWLAAGRVEDAAVLMGAVDDVRDAVGAHQDRFGAERRERVRATLITTISRPSSRCWHPGEGR